MLADAKAEAPTAGIGSRHDDGPARLGLAQLLQEFVDQVALARLGAGEAPLLPQQRQEKSVSPYKSSESPGPGFFSRQGAGPLAAVSWVYPFTAAQSVTHDLV